MQVYNVCETTLVGFGENPVRNYRSYAVNKIDLLNNSRINL